MKTRAMTIALLAAVALAGCRRDRLDDQMTGSITPADVQQARANWPEGMAAAIDSGNAAYSRQDYERARELFREATRIGPDITTGWFGVYMAEHALGNVAAADSAMQRAQSLAPGATLIHGEPADTGAAPRP